MKNKETNKNSKRILAILISFILIISIVCGLGLMIGRKTYQVKFYSDNDIVLKVDEVKRNDFAIPPKEPQISYGKIFKSWDKDLSKIRKNIDIYPVCEDVLSKKMPL